jgi:hypothetical protein
MLAVILKRQRQEDKDEDQPREEHDANPLRVTPQSAVLAAVMDEG